MIKIDNGTAETGQKMFKLNDRDIYYLKKIISQEIEAIDNIIEIANNSDVWKERQSYLRSLLKEFKKN